MRLARRCAQARRGPITTAWSKVSGQGTVTLGDARAVDTTASCSGTGTYVLRLTANDGQANASDDVTIMVSQAPGGQTTVPSRIAVGADDA